MSWRELRVFLKHLPPDSATVRAVNPAAGWSLDQHLAATVADRVGYLTALTAYINADPKRRGKFRPPDPIERPGVETRKKPGNVIRFGGRHGSGAKQLASVFGGAANQ